MFFWQRQSLACHTRAIICWVWYSPWGMLIYNRCFLKFGLNSELSSAGKGMHVSSLSKLVGSFLSWEHSFHISFAEPMFVDAHVIPDGTDPNDAKVYFFFKEKLTDNNRSTKQIHSMIARICPVRTLKFLFKEILQDI